MAIQIQWKSDHQAVTRGQEEVAAGFEKVAAAERRARQEASELNRLVRQGAKENESAIVRWSRQYRVLNQAVESGKINQQEYRDAVRQINNELDRSRRQEGIFSRIGDNVTRLNNAVDLLSRGWDLVIRREETAAEITREIAENARQAANEVVAFAALQEGGTTRERVLRAQELGGRFGVDRGEAFNIVQALQSAVGDFDEGLKRAEAVFEAQRAGLPAEQGFRLERIGIDQGLPAGQLIRQAFVSGQESAASPEIVSQATQAAAQARSPEEFAAIAGQLAGQFAERIDTFASAAIIGLRDAGDLGDTFKKLGVQGQDAVTKLRALAKAGIDTAEDLQRAGLGEQTRQAALANLIQNVERFAKLVEAVQPGNIPTDFLRSERSDVERELPELTITALNEQLEQVARNRFAFGDESVERQLDLAARRLQGQVLRDLGVTQTTLGLRLVDSEGLARPRVSNFIAAQNLLNQATDLRTIFGLGPDSLQSRLGERMEELVEEMKTSNATNAQAVQLLDEIQKRARFSASVPAPGAN